MENMLHSSPSNNENMIICFDVLGDKMVISCFNIHDNTINMCFELTIMNF